MSLKSHGTRPRPSAYAVSSCLPSPSAENAWRPALTGQRADLPSTPPALGSRAVSRGRLARLFAHSRSQCILTDRRYEGLRNGRRVSEPPPQGPRRLSATLREGLCLFRLDFSQVVDLGAKARVVDSRPLSPTCARLSCRGGVLAHRGPRARLSLCGVARGRGAPARPLDRSQAALPGRGVRSSAGTNLFCLLVCVVFVFFFQTKY